MDTYGFYKGEIFDAYEYLGAHVVEFGTVFRTYAPNAAGVVLKLNGSEIEMHRVNDGNFYEVYCEGAGEGDIYEFRIYQKNGSFVDHCDPYGFGMELRPLHASIVRDLGKYKFGDSKWMKKRSTQRSGPLNIYEMHVGSWKKTDDDEWYTYRELAPLLTEYLKTTGYNYVEFMPLSEHPVDESWGYQNTGFFAPTSRYGTAEDLMYLIDELHKNDIGVILDFVPVHFATDWYALERYDGTQLYEYPSSDITVSEWGSYNFLHSRGEVRSFLQSAANYWMQKYHFDGLRMDAISRIIYWMGDEKRGVNKCAVDFVKTMNKGLKWMNNGCILSAEDSTNYPGVTKSIDEGGLGFDYKWDMGWMHDTLNYFQSNPFFRSGGYHQLTFSMMYYYNENYMLPFSHDENVHGKATILQKMNGQYEDKFPQGRALYMYMMAHPGKKLNFMGGEIGQLREWDEKKEQDWLLLKYPNHDSFYHYMCELNKLYLNNPAFWAEDFSNDGFEWIDCHQESRNIYAFVRRGEGQSIGCILNLSDMGAEYDFNLPADMVDGDLKILLNTDWDIYGGTSPKGEGALWKDNERVNSILPPFTGILFTTTKA